MKTILKFTGLCLMFLLMACHGSQERIPDGYASGIVADSQVMAMSINEEPNQEEYATIKEQGFLSTLHHPYSTFAADVDAASYSNMRRMIMDGILPLTNSVRIEEWINYFNYNYPQPLNGEPFSINTQYAECPWNNAHKLLQIGIKGKEIQDIKPVANNLVFLIDVSGSMESSDKLPLLKRAFSLLLPKLREEDRISVVVYAGAAGALLDGVSGNNTEKIGSAFNELNAGGSTAGGEGIELAYKLAENNFIKNGNNRVILATDGDFNVGVNSEQDLEKLIEEKRNKGIYLSVLGFGTGNLKDNKMELLADKGNGNYNYIDNILEARKVLVQQFGGTFTTIAKDVKIQVEFNPEFVKEYRLIGYENRSLAAEDFNNDKKDAGEIGAGHSVTALYELVLAGSKENNSGVDSHKYRKLTAVPRNNNELANLKFRYKLPGKNDTVSKLITKPVVFNDGNERPDRNFKLAAGVAEFAMLMRNSEFKGQSNFKNVRQLVVASKYTDADGYVSELMRLIDMAEELKKAESLNKDKDK